MQKLMVGGECERRWRAVVEAMTDQELAKLLGPDLRQLYDEINSVPVEDRPSHLRSFAYNEYHKEDVEEAIIRQTGSSSRLINLRPKRPYGVRRKIIGEVAEWASERFGKKVSARQVETAWKEFRGIPKGV